MTPLTVLETSRLKLSRQCRDIVLPRYLFWDRALNRDWAAFRRACGYMFSRLEYSPGGHPPSPEDVRRSVLYIDAPAIEHQYYARRSLSDYALLLVRAEAHARKGMCIPCLPMTPPRTLD